MKTQETKRVQLLNKCDCFPTTLGHSEKCYVVRAVNARSRHIEALVKIKVMCEKQITDNPMGKTIAPEIHALVMKALDSYDVEDAIAKAEASQ